MKQAIIVLMAFVVFNECLFAQNAFYDAKKLVAISLSDDIKRTSEAVGILGKYLTPVQKLAFTQNSNRITFRRFFDSFPSLQKVIVQLKVPDQNCENILREIDNVANLSRFDNLKKDSLKTLQAFIKQIEENKVFADAVALEKIKPDRLHIERNKQVFLKLYATYIDTAEISIDSLSAEILTTMYDDIKATLDEGRKNQAVKKEAFCQDVLNVYNRSNQLKASIDRLSNDQTPEQFSKDVQVKMSQEEKVAIQTKDLNEQNNAQRLNLPTQSELIDALAIYLANRVKLETALTFIEQIKKALKSDSTLLNLFPETIRLFSTYSSYEMPNFGSVWQQAFAEDFILIPQRVAGYDNKLGYFFRKYKGNPTFDFLHQCIELAVLSSQKGNIIDIVQLLNEKYADEPADKLSLFTKFIRLFNMVNEEFYSVDKNKFWISYSDFNKLSPEEFVVMFELLSKKYAETVGTFLHVKGSWTSTGTLMNLKDLKGWMGQFFYVINQFQNNQQVLKDQLSTGTVIKTNENFWSFLPQLFKIVVGGFKEKNAIMETASNKIMSPQTLSKIIDTYEHLCEVYEALEKKDYTVAFDRTIHILDDVVSEANIKKGQTIIAFLKTVKKPGEKMDAFVANYQTAIKQYSLQFDTVVQAYKSYLVAEEPLRLQKHEQYENSRGQFITALQNSAIKNFVASVMTDQNKLDNFIRENIERLDEFTNRIYTNNYNTLTRTVSFINDVRRAGDSRTLSRVIASYANPPLSYKQKRGRRISIDLNAYVGAFAGTEFRLNGALNYSDPGLVYGLSAPIGFSVSWGRSKKTNAVSENAFISRQGDLRVKKEKNFMLTLSIIDIGAAVSYRISSGSENALPQKVSFAQVISPGLHAQWGIRNLPLCISVGGQYTPELRKFSKDPAAKAETAFSVRAGLFFDLPLMNLYRQ